MNDPLVNCPECDGQGRTYDVVPTCCGRLTRGGECRGDCAIPEQIQIGCILCGGCGQVHESVVREEAFNQGQFGVGA